MKGYVFISNGTKPTKEQYESREKIICTNVSKPCIQAALGLGYEVFHGVNRSNPQELECNMPVTLFEAHTYRSITNFKDNKIAYKNFMKLLNGNSIEVIHCNTPIGGTIGRLCGKIKKIKKVIYTVHGFHCYKGAPLFNRTVLKWAEQIMAHWTDAIITINKEDYEFAKTLKLKKGGKVYLVHGVGMDTKDYIGFEIDRAEKRKQINVNEDDFVIVSVGRLDANKNNKIVIKAVAELDNPKIKFVLCGDGNQHEELSKLACDLGVESQIVFLGNRTDVKEMYAVADCFVIASFREGLSRSLMEAMASGLPCVVSKIRGNVDLVEDGINGYSCNPNDNTAFANAINKIMSDDNIRNKMSEENLNKIKQYDVSVVEEEIRQIYNEVLVD